MDGHSSFAAVMPMDINQPGVADDLAVAVAISPLGFMDRNLDAVSL
jgi:hypothetical protein